MLDPLIPIVDNKLFPLVEVSKGQIIFKEGQPGNHAYMLKSGLVSIYRLTGNEKITIATLKPGEVFGEMAILTGEKRLATAEADEFSQLLLISGQSFKTALEQGPPLVKTIMDQLLGRLLVKEKIVFNVLASKKERSHLECMGKTLDSIASHVADYLATRAIDEELKKLFLSIAESCKKSIS